jgi:hypothetical protein
MRTGPVRDEIGSLGETDDAFRIGRKHGIELFVVFKTLLTPLAQLFDFLFELSQFRQLFAFAIRQHRLRCVFGFLHPTTV